jgi:hypothetical protein
MTAQSAIGLDGTTVSLPFRLPLRRRDKFSRRIPFTRCGAADKIPRLSVSGVKYISPNTKLRRWPPVRPNHSLNRTRYGKRRKPGPRHMVHHREPGLRRLPPQAG